MEIRDPIEELLDTDLFRYLKQRSEAYASAIRTFVSAVAPLLATTARFFPYYTRHDAHHGYRVVRRIQQILDRQCFTSADVRSLEPTEVFLLIASAYAHDLGMTVFPGEEDELLKRLGLTKDGEWQTNPNLQRFLRENHSRRGGDYINRHAERLGVPINLASHLNWMMKSHNFSIPELEQKLSDPFAADERVIDVRQLSVILCIADAIEFSDTRVMDGVIDDIAADSGATARTSYLENMKHVCIGDSLAVDNVGRIVVSGTFPDPDVLSLAHHTFDQIESWIRGYCDVDRRSPIQRLKVRPESFVRRLELGGGRFERLGVRISKKNVIDLIASNAIWKSNVGIPIRELIQNAVEACRYRDFHSGKSENYEPEVSVVFDRSARTVSVRDNGCGMSERVVLNNLLTVGNSRANEKGYASNKYKPIARFGVGFWSVFTIAQRAEVATAAAEAASATEGVLFEVALDSLKDYIVLRESALPAGTSVTLLLKHDVAIDDIFDRTRELMLCSGVKLTLVLDDQEYLVPSSVPGVSAAEVVQHRTRLIESLGVKVFQWRGTLGDTELALGLAYCLRDGHPSFMSSGRESLQLAIGGMRGMRFPKTAICGFEARARYDRLCFDLPRVGTFLANHGDPGGFEFTIDRQGLMPNEASKRFSHNIVQLVHGAYRSLLKETQSLNPERIFALNEESALNGGNVFDTFTGAELAQAFADYPDLLCFRLVEVSPGLPFSEARSTFVNLKVLAEMRGTIWMSQNHYYVPIGDGRTLNYHPENRLPLVYGYAELRLRQDPTLAPMYVVDANRPSSMLFDADPNSSVEFVRIPTIGDVCIQFASLGNIRFAESGGHVLAEVTGIWSGAVYLRDFVTPTGRPYVFLGRHRVLIQRLSRLSAVLEDLESHGRLSKLAEMIALLKEDDEGFTPTSISELVTQRPN